MAVWNERDDYFHGTLEEGKTVLEDIVDLPHTIQLLQLLQLDQANALAGSDRFSSGVPTHPSTTREPDHIFQPRTRF